jgi:hypothetical protein
VSIVLPTYTATRYAVPLREGGSLPAVIETDEAGLFVTKFRGAGQGALPLVAELIVGLLGTYLDLPVPELALIDVDMSLGRTERDPEIQDVLRGSHGLNVGLRYLDGAFDYDPLMATPFVTPELAADIVWLDAYVTNVDRTARNTNLLVWRRGLWLIDHGSALYFHFNWAAVDDARVATPFAAIRDHVLLRAAGDLVEADARMTARLDGAVFVAILDRVPDALLLPEIERASLPYAHADEARAAYVDYLTRRLRSPRAFVAEAARARRELPASDGRPMSYRR